MMLFTSKEVAQARFDICKSCANLQLNFCTDCKCFMPAKVRFANTACPQNKWGQGDSTTNEEYELNL